MNRLILTSLTLLTGVVSATACQSTGPSPEAAPGASDEAATQPSSGRASRPAPAASGTQLAPAPGPGLAAATFAGGCFWCMEPPFDKVAGVLSTTSGYAGGTERHPTYKQVAYGRTGHTESVRVIYDPKIVGYDKLLEVFWRNIDPTDAGGQFVDRGRQYRTAIFVHDAQQRAAAEASKKALGESGRFSAPIVTEIVDAGDFWVAEAYHQDFYKKSPQRYYAYRRGSGRDQFIARVWGQQE